ncbi:MAG TPA: hypothetical protein VJ792_05070 [Candidatus Nitrosotalea sp.]|nr:hypothetical protein [Candidatus Nitrosotalea sp.]
MQLVSVLLRILSFFLLVSVLQCAVFAQEESAPQTRLSSRGLAYVNLSTSPASPVAGQPTIILLEFLDPQTKAPRGDIYYKVIIRNETTPIFVLPGGSTIAGKVGIPYQFDSPGSYQVEVSLNDTDISKSTTGMLDTASFPIYVVRASPQSENVTSNSTAPTQPSANVEAPNAGWSHLLSDGILAAIAIGVAAIIVARRVSSKRKRPEA